MKVLITGATGFLGGHIVDRCIALGDSVRVLVRKSSNLEHLKTHPSIEYMYGDLSDAEAIEKATRGVDVIYHSAARVKAIGDRTEFYNDNFLATKYLVDSAKANGVKRFVFVSSPSIFFEFADQIDIDSSYPYPREYINLYSETKALAEKYVLEANSPEFIACSLRPRAIWGPRDKTGYLPKVVAGMMKGKFPDFSGGKTVLATICHGYNAADACVLAARSDKVGGKAYFITDDEKVDVWGFFRKVGSKLNLKPIEKQMNPKILMFFGWVFDFIWKIPVIARSYDLPISRYAVGLMIYTSTYDISAAKRDFGYAPKMKNEAGLEELKSWIADIGGLESYVAHV